VDEDQDLLDFLLRKAGDGIHGDPRVRWVLDEQGTVLVVLTDGRSFHLKLIEVVSCERPN
jgi:hypothetical protein